jgi:alanine-synthesizing transaminase
VRSREGSPPGYRPVAREHELIVFADEIYDRIVYDGAVHTTMATIDPELLTISFNGLSKAYRAAGFRSGWMVLSGNKKLGDGYRDGLDMLSNMRLCANVPAQFAIQTALGGTRASRTWCSPGRLKEQGISATSWSTPFPAYPASSPRAPSTASPR